MGRQYDALVGARVTPRQRRMIKAAAGIEGLTVNDFIKAVVLERVKQILASQLPVVEEGAQA